MGRLADSKLALLLAAVQELKADFNLLRANFLNGAFTKGGLTEGTNSGTIKTANTINFAINGQLYTKAATDNIACTAAAAQAVSTYCLYLVCIDSSGTVSTVKGTEVATDTAVLPARTADTAVIGAFKIATDGTHTYTAGTTDHSAAGITATYYDLCFANSGVDANTAIAGALPSDVADLYAV